MNTSGNAVQRVCVCACILIASTANSASSHTISIDADGRDWRGVTSASDNQGRIARDHSRRGEYVWRDSPGDQRPSWPARPHDLRELRLTGDADRLYIEAVFAGPVSVAGDSTLQLQLAIDTDRFTGSGGSAFVAGAATQVAANADYEYLLQTRFGSGQPPVLRDANGVPTSTVVQAALSSAGVLECAIPWTAFGSANPLFDPLRFTAAVFLSDAADRALAAADTIASRAADVVTQNGAPGATGTTAGEVADGIVNYSFDIYFDVHGDAVAPVEISEIYFGGGVKQQWIEVVNASQDVVPLGTWSIGDAETPNDGEAMAHFPNVFLSPGVNFVVARNGLTFFQDHAFRANAECENVDGATPDMLPFAQWAATTQFNIPNAGDQVLLLDRANTIVDVVTFKNSSYPGVTPHPGTPAFHSLERTNVDVDTDDCALDFMDEAAPNPGTTSIPTSRVGDATQTRLRWSLPAPNPARGRVSLTLHTSQPGPVRIEVLDVSGRRVCGLLENAAAAAGDLGVEWNGRDARGANVTAGIYLVRATTNEGIRQIRVVWLR